LLHLHPPCSLHDTRIVITQTGFTGIVSQVRLVISNCYPDMDQRLFGEPSLETHTNDVSDMSEKIRSKGMPSQFDQLPQPAMVPQSSFHHPQHTQLNQYQQTVPLYYSVDDEQSSQNNVHAQTDLSTSSNRKVSNKGLVPPIPPLHVQQQLISNDMKSNLQLDLIEPTRRNSTSFDPEKNSQDPSLSSSSQQFLRSVCSRCKKDFQQYITLPHLAAKTGKRNVGMPKIFKLCGHCRDLQRQRSRRWQKKTKDKEGACRRCGGPIPEELQKFVLCPQCRRNLRTRKASRAAQGKCVHCSGPLDTSIISDDGREAEVDDGDAGKTTEKSKWSSYKVCQRCRENDKIRRTNLEKMGNCNRCAKVLKPLDIGKHKVCHMCRHRKKKSMGNTDVAFVEHGDGSGLNEIQSSDRITNSLMKMTQQTLPQVNHQLGNVAIQPHVHQQHPQLGQMTSGQSLENSLLHGLQGNTVLHQQNQHELLTAEHSNAASMSASHLNEKPGPYGAMAMNHFPQQEYSTHQPYGHSLIQQQQQQIQQQQMQQNPFNQHIAQAQFLAANMPQNSHTTNQNQPGMNEMNQL